MIIIAQVDGSGTAERFTSPVVVPAVVRVIAAPKVNENGLAVGVNVAPALPLNEMPLRGPIESNRLAGEKTRAVLLVPPQARPVTVPLPPEFVPPIASRYGPPVRKSVSEVKRKTEPPAAPDVAVKVRSSYGAVALPMSGLLCDVLTRNEYPKAEVVKLIAPVTELVSPAPLS